MRIYEVHLNEQWRVHFLIIKYWNHTQYAYILPGVKMLSWWILSTSRINKLILTIFSPKINSRLQPCLLFWVNSICWWTPEMLTYYKLHCNYDLLLHFFKKMVLVFCSSILNLSSEYLCDARVTSDCSASFFKAIYNKKQQLIFHSTNTDISLFWFISTSRGRQWSRQRSGKCHATTGVSSSRTQFWVHSSS